MTQNDPGTPQLPSPRWLQLGSLVPFATVAVAAAVTGMSLITTVAALVGTLGPMITARTYLISLHIRPDRSLLRAEFDVWWDSASPNRHQRWYLPLIGAPVAGMIAEALRALVSFTRAHAPISPEAVVLIAGVGALEGLFVALVFALGFGLSSLLVTPRYGRAA